MLELYAGNSKKKSVNGSKKFYSGRCFGAVKRLSSGCTLSKRFEPDF